MYKSIKIFADGSCLGNPGPGGYGIIMLYENYKKIFSGGYSLTTNNRMELISVIVALEMLKEPCIISINIDSNYVRKGIIQWISNWKQSNWKTKEKKTIKNIDLWQRLDKVTKKHILYWNWIKSHSGHIENELCDKIAKKAANNPIFEDIGYLSTIQK